MKDFGRVKSTVMPQEMVITEEKVFIASDIQPYSIIIDDEIEEGYEYNYVSYDKDEYIRKITKENTDNIDMLMGCILEMSEIVYS